MVSSFFNHISACNIVSGPKNATKLLEVDDWGEWTFTPPSGMRPHRTSDAALPGPYTSPTSPTTNRSVSLQLDISSASTASSSG